MDISTRAIAPTRWKTRDHNRTSHSRIFPAYAALVLMCFSCFSGICQTSIPTVQATQDAPRDQASIAAFTAAVQALGGTSQLSGIADATVSASCQGSSPQNASVASNVRWMISGSEFLYTTTTGGVQSSMGSGHGSPWTLDDSSRVQQLAKATIAHDQPFYAPAMLLIRHWNDPGIAMTSLGQVMLSQGSAIHIQTKRVVRGMTSSGSTDDWYFDVATHMPVAYEYSVPGQGSEFYAERIKVTYASYATFGQLLAPRSISFSVDELSYSSTCSVTGISVNSHPASISFDPPSGGLQ